MFRPTDRQVSLLESQFLLPDVKRRRLEKSWAHGFQTKVLPLIDEELFRDAFHSSLGRPNASIRLLVGLHILKEFHDLTDEQVLDQLEYNLQWHYALAVEPGQAHLCQKTLHSFRVLLMQNKRAQQVFDGVTSGLAKLDGVKVGSQRVDSTHVMSNIAHLSRLGLLVESLVAFLRQLGRVVPEAFARLEATYRERYLERFGTFADAKQGQAQRRLAVVAKDAHCLLTRFAADATVSSLGSFETLRRVFDEQCTVEDAAPVLREGRAIRSTSVQNPHDLDATYGRKGKGYMAQVAETCDAENPYQVVTDVVTHGAHEHDARHTLPMVKRLQEKGLGPKELLADAAYESVENQLACAEAKVTLVAPARSTPDTPDHSVLGMADFEFDASFERIAACPAGETPDTTRRKAKYLYATFTAAQCSTCPLAPRCPTKVRKKGHRAIRTRRAVAARAHRLREQSTEAFQQSYRRRSPIESTMQELKGRHGAKRLRVRGGLRVRLALVLKALALNVKRATRPVLALA